MVQVNGKLRERLQVPADISEEDATDAALESLRAKNDISNDEQPERVIYVPGRLVNVVVKSP